MRQVIEAYALILTVSLMCILAIAFTSINLNIVQARRIYNDVRASVQASNGAIVPMGTSTMDAGTYKSPNKFISNDFVAEHHYGFMYTIKRQNSATTDQSDEDNTFIHNSIYRIDFVYVYSVPIFGTQYYPIHGYVA